MILETEYILYLNAQTRAFPVWNAVGHFRSANHALRCAHSMGLQHFRIERYRRG